MKVVVGRCEWGRPVGTPADPLPCIAQAVVLLVMHDVPGMGDDVLEIPLCQVHSDFMDTQTEPSSRERVKAWEAQHEDV